MIDSIASSPSVPGQAAITPAARVMSVDALRGFDMFWIVGGDAVVLALANLFHNAVTRLLEKQCEHVKWEGLVFHDLIFPLFVFITGVSMAFSMDKALARSGRRGALLHLARRSALLILLGLFYYGGLSNPWPGIRLTGVLQTFGVSAFLAGCVYLKWPGNPRALVGAFLALVLGYWALMTFVPFPDMRLQKDSLAKLAAQVGSTEPAVLARSVTGRVSGVFEEGYNLANYLDYRYLPGRKQYGDGNYEAQGLLQMVVATSTCLLGLLAGLWLRRGTISDARKVWGLLGVGVAGVALGFACGLHFPVVKKLWSPAFVLVAGGYSAILLGVFYFVVDVWKKQSWCLPFVWIGMNPITIYLAHNVLDFQTLATRLAGGDVKHCLDLHVAQGAGGLLIALVELALTFALVRFLYTRKVFIRL